MEYTYNEHGFLISQKNITGTSDAEVVTQFQEWEIPKQETVGSDTVPYHEYDLIGNLVEINHPESYVIKMIYDEIGQMLTRSYRDNNTDMLHSEKFTYEPGGEIVTYTNP